MTESSRKATLTFLEAQIRRANGTRQVSVLFYELAVGSWTNDISPWRMSSTTLNDRGNYEEKATRFKLLLRLHSIIVEDDKMSSRHYKKSFEKDNIYLFIL